MTVFYNFCRDHREIITSSRLCTFWPFAHNLFSRDKREDLITMTRTVVPTIFGQVFHYRSLASANHTSSRVVSFDVATLVGLHLFIAVI